MRYIGVFIAIIFVLSMAGCGKRNEIPSADDCNRMMDRKMRSDCIYNMSIGNRNPSYCKDITDMALRAKCVSDISIMLDNEAYCYQSDKLSVKEDCERKVADARKARKANITNITSP
ncbi:MAG: hypothetical protein V1875_08960 [Candidatus Altiarchaeota archaeon]